MLVEQWTKAGIGYEDIYYKLRRLEIYIDGADRREIRRYVLGLGSLVAKRYQT